MDNFVRIDSDIGKAVHDVVHTVLWLGNRSILNEDSGIWTFREEPKLRSAWTVVEPRAAPNWIRSPAVALCFERKGERPSTASSVTLFARKLVSVSRKMMIDQSAPLSVKAPLLENPTASWKVSRRTS